MGIMAQGLVVQEKIGGNKWSAASPAAKFPGVVWLPSVRILRYYHNPRFSQFLSFPLISVFWHQFRTLRPDIFISFHLHITRRGWGEACLISSLVYNFQRSTRNGNYSWCHTQGKCSDWGRLTAANTICTEKNGPLFLNWKSTLDYW